MEEVVLFEGVVPLDEGPPPEVEFPEVGSPLALLAGAEAESVFVVVVLLNGAIVREPASEPDTCGAPDTAAIKEREDKRMAVEASDFRSILVNNVLEASRTVG